MENLGVVWKGLKAGPVENQDEKGGHSYWVANEKFPQSINRESFEVARKGLKAVSNGKLK